MRLSFLKCFNPGHGKRRKELPLTDGVVTDWKDEKPKASGEKILLKQHKKFPRFLICPGGQM